MADGRHVHTDLMRAACYQVNVQQSAVTALLYQLPLCHGAAAIRPGRHFLAVFEAAADGQVDLTAFPLHMPGDQGQIVFFHLALRQLPAERHVGLIVLGHQQQPACVLIQAMYDAGAALAADAGEIVQPVEQRVDQRACLIAVGGVYHHAAGLDNKGKRFIFIQQGEGNIFRFILRFLGFLILKHHFILN